jgi:hypothetical protein
LNVKQKSENWKLQNQSFFRINGWYFVGLKMEKLSLNYLKYLKTTSKSKAKQSDVNELAEEINASWWAKNKKKFIN